MESLERILHVFYVVVALQVFLREMWIKKKLNVMHFNIELISKGMSVSCSEDNTALMYAWHMKMIMEIRVWALSCIFSWNVIQLLLKTHVIQHLC